MRQFLVLMWKHYTVRIARFIATPCELLLPSIFFIIIMFTDHGLTGEVKLITNGPEDLHTDYMGNTKILYSPKTSLTDALMKEVKKQLHENVHISPYDNNASLHDSLSAIVIFEGLNETTWPTKLRYTIRRIEGDDYHGLFHVFSDIVFMRVQWVIDSSYLTLTGSIIEQGVTIQEFPYFGIKYPDMWGLIGNTMQYTCTLSLLIPFAFLMTRLLVERATGVQELIKMVGVPNNILVFSHFVNMLPVGLLYATFGAIAGYRVFPKTDGYLIFVMLLLHFCSIMALAFVCSYLTKSGRFSASLSVMSFLVLWVPTFLYTKLPRPLELLCGLLPHVPMYWFWYEDIALIIPGGSLDWSKMWSSHSRYSGSVALALFMMCLQTVLFLGLAWYLGMVMPGKYGVGQPWTFLFKRSYWTKEKVISYEDLEENEEATPAEKSYFEELARDAPRREVGIRINNVYKRFGNETALSNVSFDVYKGEITVLLGHNGAGKTTLMSIITGMMSASSGKVSVDGMDVASAGGEYRRQLGLCPQHNLFFPDLTVLQHLIFFAKLKGSTHDQAHKSSMELLATLGIAEKANNKSDELSGGMKRRLQLACALAGGASVLILDEPTSGLDVETRRQLWDLLLTLRGSRTVLLTTHFMEEADALGDRVAALHQGRLRCHATPMYLKKNIGTGYRLSLTTVGLPRETEISRLVTSVLNGATLKESSYNSVSYNLPAQRSIHFPQLFEALEANRSDLGIESIGVGVSSLEEVFLKLCSDVDTKFTQETVDTSRPEAVYIRKTGCQLYARQAWVLMKRQAKYILSRKINFFLLQMLVPWVMIFLLTYFLDGSTRSDSEKPSTTMNLDAFDTFFGRKVLYKVDKDYEDSVKKIARQYKDVQFEDVPITTNIKSVLSGAALDADSTEYNKHQVAVEIEDSGFTIYIKSKIQYSGPVALNLVSNILAEKAGREITTVNYPFKAAVSEISKSNHHPKDIALCIIWTVVLVTIGMGVLMNTVNLPITERKSGSRHNHIMSGCPPALYWIVTLLFHVLLYTAVLVLPIAAIALVDKDMTLSQHSFIGPLILILMLGSAAFVSLGYLISFSSDERRAGILLIVIMLVFGVIPATVLTLLKNQHILGKWSRLLAIPYYTLPSNTMTSAVIKAVKIATANANCHFDNSTCSITATKKDPIICTICMERNAPGEDMIILTVQLFVYIVLVILTQYGTLNSLYDRLVNMKYKAGSTGSKDEVVRAEKAYVDEAIRLPPTYIDDAMLVNDVHKNYFSFLRPRTPCNAVKGVSFSLKKGECFGLLGVNGAGKSTTFKMITGEECPTRGGVFANGHHLKWPRSQYLQSLGYCPQFFGLDKFLSGRENLSLLLTLRGLASSDVRAETDSWIQVVGLERYKDIPVSGYSGGCTRRLAAAAALSVGAAVTLLDEPTAGVDVSARRRVWLALRRGLRHHRAVIITSHSMDEMEALCDRIAIMSGGSLGALGSACSLRAAHAAGHALVLKLGAVRGDEVDSSQSALQRLKESLGRKFNCSLKDEHKTMLHYHINETLRYSELFSALEQLKLEFPRLVEDYSVTETTLEEVFLSFAQLKQEESLRPWHTRTYQTSPV